MQILNCQFLCLNRKIFTSNNEPKEQVSISRIILSWGSTSCRILSMGFIPAKKGSFKVVNTATAAKNIQID